MGKAMSPCMCSPLDSPLSCLSIWYVIKFSMALIYLFSVFTLIILNGTFHRSHSFNATFSHSILFCSVL